jgi:hypothetical protein
MADAFRFSTCRLLLHFFRHPLATLSLRHWLPITPATRIAIAERRQRFITPLPEAAAIIFSPILLLTLTLPFAYADVFSSMPAIIRQRFTLTPFSFSFDAIIFDTFFSGGFRHYYA